MNFCWIFVFMVGWGVIFIYFIYMWSSKRYSLYFLLMWLLVKLYVKFIFVIVGLELDILWNIVLVKVVGYIRYGFVFELVGVVEICCVVYYCFVDEVVSSVWCWNRYRMLVDLWSYDECRWYLYLNDDIKLLLWFSCILIFIMIIKKGLFFNFYFVFNGFWFIVVLKGLRVLMIFG